MPLFYFRKKRIVEAIIEAYGGDPYWSNVVLAMHMDSPYIDEKGKTVSTVGTVALDSSIKKFGASSFYSNGTGYLTVPNSTDFQFGTGDFTVECWVNFSDASGYKAIISTYQNSTTGFEMSLSGGHINVWFSGDVVDLGSTTTILANTWYHVAVSGKQGALKLFINGVAEGGTYTGAVSLNSTAQLQIGATLGTNRITGYIDDLRITKGITRYTTNFSVPTSAFPSTGFTQYDSVWGKNVLLLNGNGVNNGDNNTFIDGSANAFAVTRTGNVAQGSYSPFTIPNGYWSTALDGTGDYLSLADNTLTNLASSNFTVEFWLKPKANTNLARIVGAKASTSTAGWEIYTAVLSSSLYIEFAFGTSHITLTSTTAISSTDWTHCAAVRNGSTLTLYVNGVAAGTRAITVDLTTAAPLYIGYNTMYGAYFNGNISNLRIVKNAVYSSAFSPSSVPLTAITDTVLLTCNSPTNTEQSVNAQVMMVSNEAQPSTAVPFNNPNVISTSVGSAYFDGSADYLTISDDPLLRPDAQDFTVDLWFNTPNVTTSQELYTKGTGLQIYLINGQISIAISASNNNSFFYHAPFGAIKPNFWTHVALVKEGSNYYGFINGAKYVLINSASVPNTGTDPVVIGAYAVGQVPYTGFISNVRFSKGIARYSANFTPSPITTADANTSLLLNFTNAQIVDLTGKNVIETRGNAKIVTTTSASGTGSISFDGTDDLLVFPHNSELAFGTGDFTIECWIKCNNAAQERGIFQISATAGGIGTNMTTGVYAEINLSKLAVGSGNATLVGTTSLSSNTWYHVAITRQNGTTRSFLNGNVEYTQAGNTTDLTGGYLAIGGMYSTAYLHNGYIDNFRITKGYARYTGPFMPQMSELPTKYAPNLSYDEYWSSTVVSMPFTSSLTEDKKGHTFTAHGSAALTTTGGRFGPGVTFNGTGGSYLKTNASTDFALGSNWTMECWVKFAAITGEHALISTWDSSFTGYMFMYSSAGYIYFYDKFVTTNQQAFTATTNTWYHMAISCNAGVARMYVNGTAIGSTFTPGMGTATDPLTIGNCYQSSGGGNRPLNGTISDVRITKGVSRYNGNFPVPTEPFPQPSA